MPIEDQSSKDITKIKNRFREALDAVWRATDAMNIAKIDLQDIKTVSREDMKDLDRMYESLGKLTGDESPIECDIYHELQALADRSGFGDRKKLA